jgi:probable HAF family extracellular repeat protein
MKYLNVILLFIILSAAHCPAASFSALSSPCSYETTYPLDSSDDGTIVLVYDYCYSYVWKSGEGDLNFDGTAVGADGTVVGGGGYSQAWRWQDGVRNFLGFLPYHNTVAHAYSSANNVTADGSVVVGFGYDDTHSREAFRWENGSMVGLGFLPGAVSSEAYCVSSNGLVVGGISGNEAFRWESGLMTGLGDLPGGAFSSSVTDISFDGSVMVGTSKSAAGQEAFVWYKGVMVGLGDLPGGDYSCRASVVSQDGSSVMGVSATEAGDTVFIWDENGGIRDFKEVLETDYLLDLTGWQLLDVVSLSQDGSTIIGFGQGPDGYSMWKAVIPEPATISLLAGGLLLLRRFRKQKKLSNDQ